MSEVGWERRCPICLVLGRYTATSGFRGRGVGDPLMIWNMSICGHQLTSDEFYRRGEGWARWLPGERDGQVCD